MAEAENDNALQEDREKQLVRELVKFNIYGEQTTLDGIIEAAEKNLKETQARLKELKTLFGGDLNKDLVTLPSSSTTNKVLVSSNEVNMEDENISENKEAKSENDSLRKLHRRRRSKYCCQGLPFNIKAAR